MKPTVSGWSHIEDIDESLDTWIMKKLDAEIQNLSAEQRAALRLSYLNEILPAVFRSARWDRRTFNKLVAEAELELIPRLRAKGVVLGGR